MRRPRLGHPCQRGRRWQVQVRRCWSKRRRTGRCQVTSAWLPEPARASRRGWAQSHQSAAAGLAPQSVSRLAHRQTAARSSA
ncbi:unnamed protein product [Cladocopium goreaui]|uniref:Uncharacterized protein n=1 Tax=Cladocopium goreaui TaxID=2562237 RepID=A0A9P1GQJ9_9DINO|nr:unnamed protein product [Cladocopium goreaui]